MNPKMTLRQLQLVAAGVGFSLGAENMREDLHRLDRTRRGGSRSTLRPSLRLMGSSQN
jgi:hypothetical protein